MGQWTSERTLPAMARAACLPVATACPAGATFVFNDVGNTPMTVQPLANSRALGDDGSSPFSDNVKRYFHTQFASLGSDMLIPPGSNFTTLNHSDCHATDSRRKLNR